MCFEKERQISKPHLFWRSIGYASNNVDILLILLIVASSFGTIRNRSIAYQEMALSPKDVEHFNHFCAVNVMILERLRIAFRFAHDETDVIMKYPHIEQDYKNINERWDKFDSTLKHEEFYALETYLRQLLLLYEIQIDFLQVLIPLLASIDIIGDKECPTPEMLYQPYNGDISNFNKEEIEMLYKCMFIMVPFVSAPAIETLKEKKARFKKMNWRNARNESIAYSSRPRRCF